MSDNEDAMEVEDEVVEVKRPERGRKKKEETSGPAEGATSKKQRLAEEKKSQEQMRKLDKERLKTVKAAQKKMLDSLREKQNRAVSDAQNKSAKDKLRYLLEQTEIFSHFVKGSEGSSQTPATEVKTGEDSQPSTQELAASQDSIRGSKRRGNRKSVLVDEEEEHQEEDELLQGEPNFIVRWTVSPPFVKNGEMKDYQLAGLNWLIRLYDNGINGILADEMGLGKTLQTLSFLCYLKEVRGVTGPHIIIVPKTTLPNWLKEFAKWVPSLNVFGFYGDKDTRAKLKEEMLQPGKFECVVTTYETAIKEKAAFKKFTWRYLVIDEAHRIKNENSILAQVVRLYDSQYRLLITGTPLQNNLHELWALLNFLLPDVFTSAEEFTSWFDLSENDTDQQEVINRLHKVLRPFLLRRLKSEVAKGLPPKTEIKVFVGMSAMQRKWYTNVLMKDIDAINCAILGLLLSTFSLTIGTLPIVSEAKIFSEQTLRSLLSLCLPPPFTPHTCFFAAANGTKTRLLNILMQLRKVANHPYLFPAAEPQPYVDGDHIVTNSGKMVVLDKLLKRLKEKGHRVLIFSQMTRLLDILEDYCVFSGFQYCRIDGQTDTSGRADSIDEFNAEGSQKFVFLLSTRAGGLGINLATADTVILYDSDWNPQVDLQAQDRAHRIGQTKPVTVYRFVTEGTVEQKIIERAEMKLKLDALVIQQGRLVEQNKAMGRGEMLSMIKFGADQILQAKDSTITDEDIDAIIAQAQKKSAEMDQKVDQKSKSLLDLALANDEEFNYYNFEGIDYKGKNKNLHFLEPPKRERKVSYKETGTRNPNSQDRKRPGREARPPRVPYLFPHQFFPKRLHELIDKQTAAWKAKQEKEAEAKDEAKTEDGATATSATTSNASAAAATAPEEVLTPAEEEEQKTLLTKGFGEWTKRDYMAFLKASAEYGRHSYEEIANDIESKTPQQVKEYATVFWKRHHELEGWQKVVENIEKGEKRIKEKDDMVLALKKKVAGVKDPFKNLKLVYTQGIKDKGYTEEEDTFLICALEKVGYGNWDDLKREVRMAWQFRWNWYLKSRTTEELKRRCGILVRMVQKELEGPKEKKPKAPKEEKEAATTTTTTTTTKSRGGKASAPAVPKREAESDSKKRKREGEGKAPNPKRTKK